MTRVRVYGPWLARPRPARCRPPAAPRAPAARPAPRARSRRAGPFQRARPHRRLSRADSPYKAAHTEKEQRERERNKALRGTCARLPGSCLYMTTDKWTKGWTYTIVWTERWLVLHRRPRSEFPRGRRSSKDVISSLVDCMDTLCWLLIRRQQGAHGWFCSHCTAKPSASNRARTAARSYTPAAVGAKLGWAAAAATASARGAAPGAASPAARPLALQLRRWRIPSSARPGGGPAFRARAPSGARCTGGYCSSNIGRIV
jgi:hypothetical protein